MIRDPSTHFSGTEHQQNSVELFLYPFNEAHSIMGEYLQNQIQGSSIPQTHKL